LVKQNFTEHSGVGKNQGVSAGAQHQMIMLQRHMDFGFDPQFPCHAKMKAKPHIATEFEQHLFGRRAGGPKSGSGEGPLQLDCRGIAEKFFVSVGEH